MEQRLEVVEGSGSKFLGSRGILLVEVSNLMFGVCEICCRFLGVRAFFIAFPLNSVLELSTEDMGIRDLVDFVLFFAFHRDRVRRRRFVKTVCRGCALFFAFLCLFLASAYCHSATHMIVTWTPC
jgi:hypothetical protein